MVTGDSPMLVKLRVVEQYLLCPTFQTEGLRLVNVTACFVLFIQPNGSHVFHAQH